MVHEFNRSLTKAQSIDNEPWWLDIYAQAFPGFLSLTTITKDGWAQRGGIDRVVTLKSGKCLWIEEKVRDKNYGDIALERWSDRARKTPGWIQKDLACDFICYVVRPIKKGYMLPFLPLRKAWIKHGPDWCKLAEKGQCDFKIIIAENDGYNTESVGVPAEVLFSALKGAYNFSWDEDAKKAGGQEQKNVQVADPPKRLSDF